jgi:hypothetical protein
MRTLIATVFVSALVLAGGAVVAPAAPEVFGGNPPTGLPYDPYQTYLVTRQLPNGNELFLEAFTVSADWGNQQAIRAVTLDYVDQQKTNNPAWRILLYGPIDPPLTYWTADDIIWNSTLL